MIVEAINESVAQYLAGKLDAAHLTEEPFPHVYIKNVFPQFFYDMALASLPPDEIYADRTFEHRAMAHAKEAGPFWEGVAGWMVTQDICGRLIRLLRLTGKFGADLRLIRDSPGYTIKPHTDIKAKAASCLFYLPENAEHPEIGTSVYVPRQEGFTSDGTRRYEFEEFSKVCTMPFVPNSMFAFARSDASFHAVEPTGFGPRNQLLLNIYRQ
jgi:hypothetical protein